MNKPAFPQRQAVLESKRLILRLFAMDDAQRIQLLAGEEEVATMTSTIPYPYQDGMAEKWITMQRAWIDNKTAMTLAITLRETGKLIGAISVNSINNGEGELGFWIGKTYWGRGYCTEAVSVFSTYCRSQLHLRRVYARHLTRNPASGRVMQKCGFSYCDLTTNLLHRNGVSESIEHYERVFEEIVEK